MRNVEQFRKCSRCSNKARWGNRYCHKCHRESMKQTRRRQMESLTAILLGKGAN